MEHNKETDWNKAEDEANDLTPEEALALLRKHLRNGGLKSAPRREARGILFGLLKDRECLRCAMFDYAKYKESYNNGQQRQIQGV